MGNLRMRMTVAVIAAAIAATSCMHGNTRPETGATTPSESNRQNGGWRSLFG